MSDSLSGLEKFQKQKRQNTIEKVKNAIRILQDEGKDVNFKSVSRQSSITRKTLYKVHEIRDLIESLRVTTSYGNDQDLQKIQQKLHILEEENRVLKDEIKYLNSLKEHVLNLKNFISKKTSIQSV